MTKLFLIASCLLVAAMQTPRATAQQRVLLGGKDGLAVVDPDGTVRWQMPWPDIHDLQWLDDGTILTRSGRSEIAIIDPAAKEVIWKYDVAVSMGISPQSVEVHSFQSVGDDRIMIALSGAAKIIEIDRQGTLWNEIRLVTDHPDTHSDTRLVRKLDDDSYLVAHEADGKVRQYDPGGSVLWEYEVPLAGRSRVAGHGPEAFGNSVFSATRRDNGNTLIGTGNGHSVLEVTPDKQIVWQLRQDDLPGIRLAWVTTVDVLDNGNLMIGNCHAGPGQPILIELEPATKRVVWTLDGYESFGNNVSNSVVVPRDWVF